MRKNDRPAAATPNVQVIERIFSSIDILAAREEALTLKEISEQAGIRCGQEVVKHGVK